MKDLSSSEQIEILMAVIETLQATVIALTDRIEGDDRDEFEALLDGRLIALQARMLSDGMSDLVMSVQADYSKCMKAEIGFPTPSPNAWSAGGIWYRLKSRLLGKNNE